MKLFLLSTSAMLIANGVHAATYQCNFPTDENQTTCPLPRIAFTCDEDGELACCKVTMTPEERQRVRNRTTRDSTLRQLGTVNLNNQTCTAAAEDITEDSTSSSPDEEVDTPPEEEYDAELDEEFEFAMTENRRCTRDGQCGRGQFCNTRSNRCVSNLNRCRFDSDCGSRQFCDRSLGPRGQGRCVNDSNRNRCNRDSQCRVNQICTRSGRCINTNNNNRFCRNDSQCRNRNDYCNKNRNRCERATGRSCSQGVDCGNGQGSQWMCRQGRCQPRSLFEMAMMETE